MRRFSAALVIFLLSGCVTVEDRAGLKPSDLNGAPSQYDGKQVDVAGWMILESEEVALWDTRADRDKNQDPRRCVSLLVPKDVAQSLASLNRSEVSISGVFHASVEDFKPMMFIGLCNVSAIELHESEEVRAIRP
jgi:hypothetical protein